MASTDTKIVLVKDYLNITDDHHQNTIISGLASFEKREGERRGWDQSAQFVRLNLRKAGMIEAITVPSCAWNIGHDNPVDCLVSLARQAVLSAGGPPGPPIAGRPDGFFAMAFMCEAWSVLENDLTEADWQERAQGDRVNHLHPKRVELRLVTAVDVQGNVYGVQRQRGGQPEYSVNGESENGTGIRYTGKLPAALRILTAFVASTQPGVMSFN